MKDMNNLHKNLKEFFENVSKRARLNEARQLNFLSAKSILSLQKRRTLDLLISRRTTLKNTETNSIFKYKLEREKPGATTYRNELRSFDSYSNYKEAKTINELPQVKLRTLGTFRSLQWSEKNKVLTSFLKQQSVKVVNSKETKVQRQKSVNEFEDYVQNKYSISSSISFKDSKLQNSPCSELNFKEERPKAKRHSMPYINLKLALISASSKSPVKNMKSKSKSNVVLCIYV
eukprot:TRINITY_DN17715_c0_g1_i1.p1 TRINITY_DN17715_c0_g1~~TRINITY_DN17715_c0_g1_i1.p1  ORF type:complete len:232 (-),score=12.91 TRINITY_DN17715_c0_g1_i1:354-1049(-)